MAIKQKGKSLQARDAQLADSFYQLKVLNGKEISDQKYPDFAKTLGATTDHKLLQPIYPEIFQINIGKLCNQTCAHCHVDAGPDRKEENMDLATLTRCL